MAIIRAAGLLLLDMNAVTEKYLPSPQNMMTGRYPGTNFMEKNAAFVWFLFKEKKWIKILFVLPLHYSDLLPCGAAEAKV